MLSQVPPIRIELGREVSRESTMFTVYGNRTKSLEGRITNGSDAILDFQLIWKMGGMDVIPLQLSVHPRSTADIRYAPLMPGAVYEIVMQGKRSLLEGGLIGGRDR